MDSRTEERVTGWNTRSFAGGFAGVRALADEGFTGAIAAGGAWLFVLNGRIVGVVDGTIEDVADADGTAYVAPDPALPLLFSMLEIGGETQAEYYTEDTPLGEADRTLRSGNFVGYVELSENVMSGDYYVVYYGGKSLSAAFLGASERLVTGEEALERAMDEVGIYEVKRVELEVVDVPEPAAEPESTPTPQPDLDEDDVTVESTRGVDDEYADTDADTAELTAVVETDGHDDWLSVSDDPVDPTAEPDRRSQQIDASTAAEADASSTSETGAQSEEKTPDVEGTTPAADSAKPDTDGVTPDPEGTKPDSNGIPLDRDGDRDVSSSQVPNTTSPVDPKAEPAQSEPANALPSVESSEHVSGDGSTQQSDDHLDDVTEAESTRSHDSRTAPSNGDAFSAEKQWQESHRIPALDPNKTGRSRERKTRTLDRAAGGSTVTASDSERRDVETVDSRTVGSEGTQTEDSPSRPEERQSPPEAAHSEPEERRSRQGSSTENGEAELTQLQERLATVKTERDALERERDRLQTEIANLETTIEEVTSDRNRLRERLESEEEGIERRLEPTEALENTNLFVRYGSKGGPTLETARDGTADRDDVASNLRIEHHTRFDEEGVVVDGRPFDAFLTDTMEYQLVEWLTGDLLYEIRDTDHTKELSDLYDAIPQVDRAELNGSVSVQYVEDGEEYRERQRFDLVLRDRMGNPLLVANCSDSRDPVSEEMLDSLVESASRVKESKETLSGALFVSASFFEPEALETAAEATSSGFLSGGSKESFVTLSRKRGYHLLLAESRGGKTYLTVPEL